MSTVSTSQGPRQALPDDSDPLRCGWRYTRVKNSDGSESMELVPLTLEDALHPEDGDHIVHSDSHDDDLKYLKSVFKSLLADDPQAVVLSDCGVDLNLPGVRPICPDIAIFFDVRARRDWKVFDIEAEHARSALVVEVTSESTRSNDVVVKFDYYHRAAIPTYVIADARIESEHVRRLELIAYRYTSKRYERVAPSADGRIWLDAVGVWLGISQDSATGFDRIACFDPATTSQIGDYTAITQARAEEIEARIRAETRAAAAETQAAAAEARAVAAEIRIRELEAALRNQSLPGT
jgi:Uma2 family endonuclease